MKMANKISLANKYRPKEFSDVVEQDSIKTILLNQMQTDNLKHAYLFCGSAGTGKAQPLDSLILTPAGYVKMGDIKIGDKVIDGLGNETIVTDIFPQGIKPIYQVIFSDGASVLCSDEHLWKVQIDNTWYIKDTMSIKNNLYNTKYNVPLPDLTKYENIIDKTLFEKYYNLDEKYIVDIVYLKLDYCQCILVESDDHTYITDDLTVTHNTTSARIIANMMNEGKGRIIELDCASHNGVDDMRNIIEECKSKPIQGKYKIFVLDECMTPDTEILTDKGYKQFKDLDHTEKIAQYNDDGSIEFVTPKRWIKQHYEGYLECWQPRRGHIIKMTPHHQQPLLYNKSGLIKSNSICDIKFAQSNSLILAGQGVGNKTQLSYLDRLAIICQADGSIQYERDSYNHWLVSFKKQRKIDRFLDIIEQSGVEYNEINSNRVGYRRFTFNLPKSITKELQTHFDLDISYEYARDFIDEIKNWDGYIDNNYIYYSSVEKKNVDFVSAVATLGGYSAKQKQCVDNRSDNYNDTYRLWLYDRTIRNCQYLQKYKTQEYYNGDVYCVEVPSHKIIVRANGYTFVTGNCHMLTVQAWNSLLKILEEPPEFVIFLFCTTDPQKIIGTVMSRVQRFNFQRISVNGIYNRLKYIIENENKERQFKQENIITFEDDALNYIARLAKGGMRDSITTLEKCLDYNINLTLNNVLKVTSGSVTENDMMKLTDCILQKDAKSALILFNEIYNSGIDISLFMKMYIEFIENCNKLLITSVIELTTLSDISVNWLRERVQYRNIFNMILIDAGQMRLNYTSDDMKIIIESWLMKVCSW